jgi:hypothetical protein
MFVDEIRRAVHAAPRQDLPRLAETLWKGWAAAAIGEGAAQELSELDGSASLKASQRLPLWLQAACWRKHGAAAPVVRGGTLAASDRRKVHAGRARGSGGRRGGNGEAGRLPAVDRASCGPGGVCASTVKNAMREARRLGLISIEERRVSAFQMVLPAIGFVLRRAHRAHR